MCTSSDPSRDSNATIRYNEEVDMEDGSSKRKSLNEDWSSYSWVQHFAVGKW